MAPPESGKRGAPVQYSDLAIETALTLRLVFHLAYRQTEGFVQSLIGLMRLKLRAPDYSWLCRRAKTLKVAPVKRDPGQGLVVVVDSSGLKVFGQGEWDATKHGAKKRRTWRKLHLCIDEATLDIVSHELTTKAVGDPTAVPSLLDQVDEPIDEFLADGVFDTEPVYDAVIGHKAGGTRQVTVPPRSNAQPSSSTKSHRKKTQQTPGGTCQHEHAPPSTCAEKSPAPVGSKGMDSEPPSATMQRDAHVDFIERHGREVWEYHNWYCRRLKVENAVGRYKTIIGDRMRARTLPTQKTEAAIGCKILNRMNQLGLNRMKNAA